MLQACSTVIEPFYSFNRSRIAWKPEDFFFSLFLQEGWFWLIKLSFSELVAELKLGIFNRVICLKRQLFDTANQLRIFKQWEEILLTLFSAFHHCMTKKAPENNVEALI